MNGEVVGYVDGIMMKDGSLACDVDDLNKFSLPNATKKNKEDLDQLEQDIKDLKGAPVQLSGEDAANAQKDKILKNLKNKTRVEIKRMQEIDPNINEKLIDAMGNDTQRIQALKSVLDLKTYTVKEGETLDSISDKFGISLDDLKKANPNLKSVDPGQSINLPTNYQDINSMMNNVDGVKAYKKEDGTTWVHLKNGDCVEFDPGKTKEGGYVCGEVHKGGVNGKVIGYVDGKVMKDGSVAGDIDDLNKYTYTSDHQKPKDKKINQSKVDAATKKIKANLKEDKFLWFENEVTSDDLNNCTAELKKLTPDERNEVIASMSDAELELWLKRTREMSTTKESRELYETMFEGLDGKQLARVFDLSEWDDTGYPNATGMVDIMLDKASPETKKEFIDAVKTKINAGEDRTAYPLARTICSLSPYDAEEALKGLSNDQLESVIESTLVYPSYSQTFTDLFSIAMRSADPNFKANVLMATTKVFYSNRVKFTKFKDMCDSMQRLLLSDPNGVLNALQKSDPGGESLSTLKMVEMNLGIRKDEKEFKEFLKQLDGTELSYFNSCTIKGIYNSSISDKAKFAAATFLLSCAGTIVPGGAAVGMSECFAAYQFSEAFNSWADDNADNKMVKYLKQNSPDKSQDEKDPFVIDYNAQSVNFDKSGPRTLKQLPVSKSKRMK